MNVLFGDSTWQAISRSSSEGLTAESSILRCMRIWLDLPDALVAQLIDRGQDLSRSALEAMAIDAYRMRRLTSHQLCQLLEISSRDELDGFLKHHGVPLEYTVDDFERERTTSARL
jgi:uncharacterized protein UPF0175